MPTLVDTGFLFALANVSDIHHDHTLEVAPALSYTIILPVTVLPEICYLLDSRLGHGAIRQFLAQLQADLILAKTTRLKYNGPQQPNKGQGRNPALFYAIIHHTSEAETGE